MANNSNQSVASEVTWQISIKWGGIYKTSPEYKSAEEAAKNLIPFLEKFQGRFFTPTFVRNVKHTTKG